MDFSKFKTVIVPTCDLSREEWPLGSWAASFSFPNGRGPGQLYPSGATEVYSSWLSQLELPLFTAGKKSEAYCLQTPTSYTGQSIGRYTLHELIGRGSMGTVYRATGHPLFTEVAIKVCNECSEENSRRLMNEGRNASAVAHPNVIPILDIDQTADQIPTVFIVMELFHGTLLSELHELKERYSRSELDKIAIGSVVQVLAGLEHAHHHGVLHRDIKPNNIMIQIGQDSEGMICRRAKLMDFGVSKEVCPAASEKVAEEGELNFLRSKTEVSDEDSIVGTLRYMAPEQTQPSKSSDYRSDLYGIAATLYELLAGEAPIEPDDTDTYFSFTDRIRNELPRDLHELRPDLPAEFCENVMKNLRKDPSQRHDSAGELRIVLSRFLEPA